MNKLPFLQGLVSHSTASYLQNAISMWLLKLSCLSQSWSLDVNLFKSLYFPHSLLPTTDSTWLSIAVGTWLLGGFSGVTARPQSCRSLVPCFYILDLCHANFLLFYIYMISVICTIEISWFCTVFLYLLQWKAYSGQSYRGTTIRYVSELKECALADTFLPYTR